MLAIPEAGMSRSVNAHNVDLMVLSDWIEGNVLFAEPTLSTSDVVSTLCEGNVYAEQDFALERVDDAWREITRRQSWVGDAAPMRVEGRRIHRVREWWKVPAHSFSLIVTFARHHRSWARSFGADYTAQGSLFEALAGHSLKGLGWEIHRTGWEGALEAEQIEGVITGIADCLGEVVGNIDRWRDDDAKDAGLDLVCHRPFVDSRGGKPVYLMQCASGGNWDTKLHTPDLSVWSKLIDFTTEPQRAFAMPFALDDDPFRRVANRVNGLLLDRYRILSAGRNGSDWLPRDLKLRLLNWLRPRVRSLPRLSD